MSGGFFRWIRNKTHANGFVIGHTDVSRRIAHNRAKAHRLVSTLIEARASMSRSERKPKHFQRSCSGNDAVRVGYLE